jgi:rhamnosyltransferase
MIKNFSDKQVVGVYARQIPYKNTNILESYSYSQDYPNIKKVWYNNNFNQEDLIFSDVSSAIRRNVILKYPYNNDILVSEDRDWAYRILNKGHKIVYEPTASVIHSHNNSLINTFKLFFDMGVSHNYIYSNYAISPLLKKGIKRYQLKLNYLIKSGHFLLLFNTIIFDTVKFVGMNLGKNEKMLPIFIKKKFSNYKSYWERK